MLHQTDCARVLVVDDDDKLLATIRRIIHGYYDIITTKDPMQALKIFEYQGPFAVVISDYRMPVMNGIELLSRIHAINKNVQRIILTGHAELQMAIDAINRGKITAFLTKPTPAVSIRTVITEAIRTYSELQASQNSASTISSDPQQLSEQPATKLYVPLTVKEKEVLTLLSKGLTNNEISIALNVTIGTVKTHLINLFGKLDVTTRSKAVVRALELGLLKS